jgi:ATP-binding cassette subfamily B protein
MTLYSLALLPLVVVTCMWFFQRIQKQFTVVEEADGRLSTIMQENLTGVRVVRAFGRERFELDKFRWLTRIFGKKARRSFAPSPFFGAAPICWS